MATGILGMGLVTAAAGGWLEALVQLDSNPNISELGLGAALRGVVGLVAATALHFLGTFWASWMFFAATGIITGVRCSSKGLLEKHKLHLITAAAVLLAAPLLRAVAFRVLFRA